MNIWTKMITALKGGINEAGEAVVDSQALRILDQEIREAAEELNQSKASLAEILAHQKVSEEKASQLAKQQEEHETYALQALEKGDEALALEIAEKIAGFEQRFAQEKELSSTYQQSADKIRNAIQQSEYNLKRLKQQVDTVKANDSVQRAQQAVAERYSGSQSKMRTAMESLERIKEKQQLNDAKLEATNELAAADSDQSLAEKLEKAGISKGQSTAKDILERLKNKK